MIRRLVLGLLLMGIPFFAQAHTQWADGSSVPEWVKASCCGPADAHHLDASDVSLDSDGYHVKGYPYVIAYKDALPSMDGEYWVFYGTMYNTMNGETNVTHPYCFFAPTGA